MRGERVDLSQFSWMNPPAEAAVTDDRIEFVTTPETDFWQRTHYGFRRDNGHAFLTHLWDDFTFSAAAEFFYESLFDQCGLLLYTDADNWAKVAVEYVDESASLLGSVVTTHGYSDWASSPIATDHNRLVYRLSRRGADFRFEASLDGEEFQPLRVFHLAGDLTTARVGVYACSPSDSSFTVRFSEVRAGPSLWHG